MAVDKRDWPVFLSVFTPDAQLITRAAPGTGRSDEVRSGLDQIGQVRAVLEPFDRTFHMVGQSSYQVEGDQAEGIVYCQAHHFWTDDSGGNNLVMYIRYHDAYARGEDGEWRIRSRVAYVEWSERRTRKDG